MNRKVYFLSDAHLGSWAIQHRRTHERRLVSFLDKIKGEAAAIYFLGDMFDFWYEYKHVVPKGFTRFLGKISELTDDLEGHGGGDHRMIDKLYEVLTKGNDNVDTAIANSVESHYMALAAEDSRLLGGTPIKIEKYRKI